MPSTHSTPCLMQVCASFLIQGGVSRSACSAVLLSCKCSAHCMVPIVGLAPYQAPYQAWEALASLLLIITTLPHAQGQPLLVTAVAVFMALTYLAPGRCGAPGTQEVAASACGSEKPASKGMCLRGGAARAVLHGAGLSPPSGCACVESKARPARTPQRKGCAKQRPSALCQVRDASPIAARPGGSRAMRPLPAAGAMMCRPAS